MQKKMTVLLFALMAVSCSKTDGIKPASIAKLDTDKQKLSYSLGLDIGGGLKKQEIDVDLAVVMKGIGDGLAEAKPLLTEDEIKSVMMKFQEGMMEKAKKMHEAQSAESKKKADDFLAQNKTKEGVVTTASGLQYKILKEGTGDSPKPTDTVTVNYRGTLVDGTEFDSSYARNEPVSFPVNGVIPGWVEGLQLMKPGSKYQFFIAPELAYGEAGSPPSIGPNEALVFEVELISVNQ